MDTKQIKETLDRIFRNNRIVFWYDAEKEFDDVLPSIGFDDATLLRLDEHGSLELKIMLESEDPGGKYLLYAPYGEPTPDEDWLLDIRLYSQTFHADQASILLNELNLQRQSLRPHVKKRKAFFKSQDRMNRLKKWVVSEDGEDEIDLKMIAVLTRAAYPDMFSVLMSLLADFCSQGKFEEDEPPKSWTDIEKFGLKTAFWRFLTKNFGYAREDSPNLTDFLLRLFTTDLANSLDVDPPPSISHFVLDNSSQSINCAVFLSQWRTNTAFYPYYNRISKTIAGKLKIDELLTTFDFESLLDVMTFEFAERRIVSSIRDHIKKDPEKDYTVVGEAIKKRLDGYWATTDLDPDSNVNLYRTVYKALETAIQLFELRKEYDSGLSYESAEKMFQAYTSDLFRFDQDYRIFHELADKANMAGWDVLKSLRETVENCYSGWFMDQLALKWGDFLKHGESDGLIENWKLSFVPNQYGFFDKYVGPVLRHTSRNRIFVIVSDAFRFEAAYELAEKVNGKYRMKADLEAMLGILPGYTALGMAALLPHKTISFKEGPKADVLVDGKLCGSLDQRADILKEYNGTAVKFETFMSMTKDSGRDFIKPYQVIYIYHDKIDAVGDKAVSESNCFQAVRDTINEIYALVKFIINSLNGTKLIVTADHGFVYQEKAPEPIDKSALKIDLCNAVKTHKRFILGKNLDQPDNSFKGNVKETCGADTDLEFLTPKSTNRYNFIGGARFFHGGTMLQEIAVPVVSVSQMKGKHLEKSEVNQVGISLLGSYKKLVTNRPIFKMIQTDPVSERMKPRTLKISLRDGNELISNEETVTFDIESSSIDDRQKSVKLILKSGTYDNKKEYFLVIRNIDDTEFDSSPIYIDIAFANDF